MKRTVLLPLLAIIAGFACACESPLLPGEARELERAEARWAARPFRDYSIEIRTSCFCPSIINQWARVEVINGSIARVVLVDGGTEVSPAERTYFRTVESVFEAIHAAHRDEWTKDIVARYDPLLGFPTYVSLIAKDGIADAGSVHDLRSAAPLPDP